jgi:hypothetical protein
MKDPAIHEAVHADVVAALAEKTHQPLPVVKKVYEEELARLKAATSQTISSSLRAVGRRTYLRTG